MLSGGSGGRLQLSRSVYDGMVVHATEMFPSEAVGLLGGTNGIVTQRIPLLNAVGGRRFLVDPYAQFQALRQISAGGLEPLAVYHSHPGGGTHPSAEDLRFAGRLPYLQLIIAIGRPHNTKVEIAAYEMHGLTFQEATLSVVP